MDRKKTRKAKSNRLWPVAAVCLLALAVGLLLERGGLAGLAACLFWMIRGWHYPLAGSGRKWHIGSRKFDDRWGFLFIGLAAQYLPWVLVSRLTFIYHYFASVPWIIIATAQLLRYLERRKKKAAYAIGILLGAAAAARFVLFYPLASGAVVPREWCDAAAWFDGWLWY